MMLPARRLVPLLALTALLLAIAPAAAQQHRHRLLALDDFESYMLGSLDKNDPNGMNMDANGQGNPWFGPRIPDLVVVNAENGIQPISGTQMVRGSATPGFSQNWYNIAYRLNGSQPFTGNIILSWWFYDPVGPGNTDYRDYVALAFYDTAPPDTDAPANYNLNTGVMRIQRLSLGAMFNTDLGFDPTYYQARVVGNQNGYNANGWFNTQTPRSVGWHQAAIHVGPLLSDGGNLISFYIDDGGNPTLEQEAPASFTYGYNVVEMNAAFGAQTAYYDDISLYRGKKHEVARIFGQ
jgi:hypothetical protein